MPSRCRAVRTSYGFFANSASMEVMRAGLTSWRKSLRPEETAGEGAHRDASQARERGGTVGGRLWS